MARRLYRSENDGPFVFVAQLNRQDTVFVDNGTTRGGFLHVPPIGGITLTPQFDGTLTAGTYNYRLTYVNALGKESRASDVSASVVLDGNPTELNLPGHGAVLLDRLPTPQASGNYVGRRIYRSTDTGAGPYQLVAEIDATSASFLDDGTTDPNVVLDASVTLGRPEGRLSIDPSIVVKLDGARFEVEMGAQMIAEGDDGREIIFTSIADDRYGAGGTFDTGNDGAIISGSSNDPVAGDWGGIYAAQLVEPEHRPRRAGLRRRRDARGGHVHGLQRGRDPRQRRGPRSPTRCSSSTAAARAGRANSTASAAGSTSRA